MKFEDLVVTINVNRATQSCMAATDFAKSLYYILFVFKLAQSLQIFLFICFLPEAQRPQDRKSVV